MFKKKSKQSSLDDLRETKTSKKKQEEAEDSEEMEESQGPAMPDDIEETFEEDFSDVSEDSKYPVISEGAHTATVVDFEKGESKNGNPQYVWQLEVIEGVDEGKQIRYWTSLLPQARWKVVESLEAIGIEASGKVLRFKATDIIGKICQIEVGFDKGRNSHKIIRMLPTEGETQGKTDTPF